MTEHYTVRLCSEKSAYEIKARKRITLDLPSIVDKIADRLGMEVRLALPALAILIADDGRVFNLFPDGRMLLRGLNSAEEADHYANEIAEIIFSSENSASDANARRS